ncbi:MAG: DUF192 domain-containing protein [Luteitalea sp.]|nr:DUF192 domain-containing protein [Luteitalea sp.]
MAGGNSSFLRGISQDAAHRWTLRRASGGQVVAGSVIPAFDRVTRNKGLLGRRSLEPGSAMVLAPCNSVHTFFMKFPIDIVFVSRDGRVLKIRPRCGAWRLAFGAGAFAVIELPSGAAEASGVGVGDRLEIV